MTTRAEIAAAALALVGTPYVHQGRVAGHGVDCAGVLIVVARQLGLVPAGFDVTGYTGTADGVSLRRYCQENMTPVARGEEQAGDAVLVHWGGHPQHLGVLVPYRHGGLSIVHALGPDMPARVVESRWLPKMTLVAAFSFPGVA